MAISGCVKPETTKYKPVNPLSLSLSMSLSVCLSVCLSVYLSIYLHLYMYISVYLSIYLSIYIYIYISTYTYICSSVRHGTWSSVRPTMAISGCVKQAAKWPRRRVGCSAGSRMSTGRGGAGGQGQCCVPRATPHNAQAHPTPYTLHATSSSSLLLSA